MAENVHVSYTWRETGTGEFAIVRRFYYDETPEVAIETFDSPSKAAARMGQLESDLAKTSDHTPKLYIIHLAGSGLVGQSTSTVAVVAVSKLEAESLAKQKWTGDGECLVSAVQQLADLDGYRVSLTPMEASLLAPPDL